MYKLLIKDFIAEVKSEIICFESINEEKANEWEDKFTQIIHNPRTNKKNIKDGKYYMLQDESEIFAIADGYVAAVEDGTEQEYWSQWD